MTEHDAFEIRFGAAVHGYVGRVSSDLDPAEFAYRIATAAPRRRGFAPTLALRGATIPRRSWVLLLMAALLTATVVGMLIVGAQPVQKLPALVPPVAPAFACPPDTDPDQPGPVDQIRPTDTLPSVVLDRRAGRLVALAEGPAGATETWTFDVCTNTWMRMQPDREPSGSGDLVYDVDSDVTIMSDGIRTWVYDLTADTWTEKAPAPIVRDEVVTWFYDPFTGLVVALGDDEDDDTLGFAVSTYDVESDTWTLIHRAESRLVGPHYEFLAYDASVDRLVAYSNAWGPPDGLGDRRFAAKAWLFDIRAGRWSESDAVAPGFSAGMWGHVPAMAYDEASRRTVILGQGHSAAYDATADHWETLYESASEDPLAECPTRPECRQLHRMVYDPVNERLIIYGGFVASAEGPVDPDDVLAVDTQAGVWTVLLEPSDAQPTPTTQ